MKKFFYIIILTFLFSLPLSLSLSAIIRAQEESEDPEMTVTTTSQDLTAEIIQETQDPGSKEVTFYMRLNSNITADRVKITWELQGAAVFAEDVIPQGVINVEPGNTYDIAITIVPGPASVAELFGKAEAFQVDGTIVATVRANFATNQNSEILPLTPEYEDAKRNHQIQSILETVGIVTVIVVVFVVLILRLIKYLRRDDVAAYDKAHKY